jgi:GR25 family glycosyltransferase involved in LPS biosynthesis
VLVFGAVYAGIFINLDRSVARRARIERHLAQLGLSHLYARFAAIDGGASGGPRTAISPAEYGCFASHTAVITDAASSARHLHVVEDDAILAPELRTVIPSMIEQGVLDEWDLLFTDVFIAPHVETLRRYDAAYRQHVRVVADPPLRGTTLSGITLSDLRETSWACMSSYLVSLRALPRLAKWMGDTLRAGPSTPIDIAMRHAVNTGRFKAAVCLPFLSSVELEVAAASTLRNSDQNRLFFNALRQTFFLHPDWESIDRVMEKCVIPHAPDRRQAALMAVLGYAVYGHVERF